MSIKLNRKGTITYINDHRLLGSLAAPNQHPISSIIGLEKELHDKYIKPTLGIPDKDLEFRYALKSEVENFNSNLLSMITSIKGDVVKYTNDFQNNIDTIENNTFNISNIYNKIEILKNQIDSIPDLDNIIDHCGGSTHIKQESFIASDSNKVLDINIIDTDLKVIKPTILKTINGESVVATIGLDYEVIYPSDTTLRINFIANGEYIINYIAGELTDDEFNVLLNNLKKLEDKINLGMAGNGAVLHPHYNVELEYDGKRVIKEIYTGSVNKVVEYDYDANDNVIKKTVIKDDVIKIATYLYDLDGNLIEISDNGTEVPVDGTKAKSFELKIEYDEKGFISKETYTGGINKTIIYTNSIYGDVLEKSVIEDGVTKKAKYIYDNNRKLIKIEDKGTESIVIVYPDKNITSSPGVASATCGTFKSGEMICGTGAGGNNVSFDTISNAEIDLIFETIFK